MSAGSRASVASSTGQGGSAGRDLDLLFRREAPRLVRYFRRRTGSPVDALDLTQETFSRLAGAAPAGAIASPQRYLQRIARNLLFDRAKAAPSPVSFDPDREIGVRAEQEDGICYRDLFARYQAAVDTLTPRTRQVFVLHRVAERTYAQIAGELDISVKTVEYHMARAIVAIGEALEQG